MEDSGTADIIFGLSAEVEELKSRIAELERLVASLVRQIPVVSDVPNVRLRVETWY